MASTSHNIHELYQPLGEGEIRLLHFPIDSTETVSTHSLRVELTTVKINGPIKWEALSYTWGDPSVTADILCNDQPFSVRLNLFSALKQLYAYASIDSINGVDPRPRYWWIDAICINQGCFEERSQQVSLMRTIYHDASRVCVWLGENVEDGKTFVPFELVRKVLRDWGSLPPPESLQWRLYKSFLRHPYFDRIWIIQELAVAREVELLCGEDHIPWSEVVNGTQTYLFLHEPTYDEELEPARIRMLQDIRNTYQRAKIMAYSLFDMLLATRSSLASDPRDRVYGLLGLCMECEPPQPLLIPDYTLTTEQTYMAVVIAYIAYNRNLDILRACEPGRAHQSLPSWVPDWRCLPDIFFTNFDNRSKSRKDLLDVRKYPATWAFPGGSSCLMSDAPERRQVKISRRLGPCYVVKQANARGEIILEQARLATSPASSRLTLTGKRVSMVRRVGPCYMVKATELDQELPREQARLTMKAWEEIAAEAANGGRQGTELAEDFARAIGPLYKTAKPEETDEAEETDKSAASDEADDELLANFCLWYETYGTGLLDISALSRRFEDRDSIPKKGHNPSLQHDPEAGERVTLSPQEIAHQFGKGIARGCYGRRFFITESGYMGLTKRLQEGDLFTVLSGGHDPWILRPRGSNWTLVEASYVQGLDLNALMGDDEHPLEDFVLE